MPDLEQASKLYRDVLGAEVSDVTVSTAVKKVVGCYAVSVYRLIIITVAAATRTWGLHGVRFPWQHQDRAAPPIGRKEPN